MTPVRLEPAALQSIVKHSTTEPLGSLYTEQLFSYFQKKVNVEYFGMLVKVPHGIHIHPDKEIIFA